MQPYLTHGAQNNSGMVLLDSMVISMHSPRFRSMTVLKLLEEGPWY